MFKSRISGILVHPTSFPSKYGIGDLGNSAIKFIDFLEKSQQSLWQILPLGPTSFKDSPYQSFSSFAGNHLLISPDILIQKGYLLDSDICQSIPQNNFIDYGKVIDYKNKIFKIAFENFISEKNTALKSFKIFCKNNSRWLDDYALFSSLKTYFINQRKLNFDPLEYKKFEDILGKDVVDDYYYGAVWATWPDDIKTRKSDAINFYSNLLYKEIKYVKFLQYEFFCQWNHLKSYANKKGISIIGDLPIFTAYDSCDVWANTSIFKLDKNYFPTVVAGVPPDYFSEEGQLWGNPIYDWDKSENNCFKWWSARIRHNLKFANFLRIDHFKGFDEYFEIPFGNINAKIGDWSKGPGKNFFKKLLKELKSLPFIAEDLGVIGESTKELKDTFNFPGMNILQFAFTNFKNTYLPHNIDTTNSVIYTGTHDNDTTLGWYLSTNTDEKDYVRRYLNISGENISWDLIRLAYSSISNVCIIPIQDIMNLDSTFRMNIPGNPDDNWKFRYSEDMLLENYCERFIYLNYLFNRNII